MDELELMHVVVACMMAKHGISEFCVSRDDAQEVLKGMGLFTMLKDNAITVRFLPSQVVEQMERDERDAA